jgi:hypothetical protein
VFKKSGFKIGKIGRKPGKEERSAVQNYVSTELPGFVQYPTAIILPAVLRFQSGLFKQPLTMNYPFMMTKPSPNPGIP